MDRRSWPWKKKSYDKAAPEKTAAVLDSEGVSLASAGSHADQDNYKKPKYVQISVESYTHLTGLEEQVKTFEEQVKKYEEKVNTRDDEIKDLNEKLTAALAAVQAEVTAKENLVKQHAKVAEEAVSGWEKAEAEALALKNHLETVTLSRLSSEERAAHLDGALKECMRKIRNLKEEHEQKLQDVIHTKSKQMERLKVEFEAKIMDLDQELLRSAGENAAISRSLQERSNMLMKVSEEKMQAEADIEMLKSNIESCEREINSLKYELHIASKELEIRTEEKNMSVRSAEVANKQHMEGVKKITKLEAECQRLRGLVRKKLPGPAALAQMKLEVESLGHDYGETRQKRSPVKPPSPRMAQATEFSLDNVQKFHKENEFLTERLLAMEEETKMLKEALAKRNSELLSSRNMCAQTASRLQSLEAQTQLNNQQINTPRSSIQIPAEGFSSQNASHLRSVASMSEDGNDDNRSCAESCGTGLVSELSTSDKSNKADNHLELMDDFLEMEKLACLSNDKNGAVSVADVSNNNPSDVVEVRDSRESTDRKELHAKEKQDIGSLSNQVSSNVEQPAVNPGPDVNHLLLVELRSRIAMVIDSVSEDTNMEKFLEDIKCVVQDAHDPLRHQTVSSVPEHINGADVACDQRDCPEDSGVAAEKEIAFFQDSKPSTEYVHDMSEDLKVAISQIHDFVLFLGKEAMAVYDLSPNGNQLNQKIEQFSATFNKLMHGTASWDTVVLDLSHVLADANKLRFNVMGYKTNEVGSNSPDCIDKVALPENRTVQKDSSGGRYQKCLAHISDPTSDSEIPDDGHVGSGYESNTTYSKSSTEEFEQLKSEKDNMAVDFARSTENLEMTKSQLVESEQLLAELKSQLASAKKSSSLADTQLKCMAESYRSLEKRADVLDIEVNLLRAKTESLVNELEEEKRSHQDALARCNDLQEQLQRKESCSVCSVCLATEADIKTKKENELAAAAEKLAECQETIFLLGRQLKAMHPPNNQGKGVEDEPTTTTSGVDLDEAEMDTADYPDSGRRVGAESPIDLYTSPCSPESNLLSSMHKPKHRPTKSASSTPEKPGRGFSRFFSQKGKNGY